MIPTANALSVAAGARNHRNRLDFIRPGKPLEHALIESFNGRLRDECLNVHQFASIADAKTKIEAGAWTTISADHTARLAT